MTNEKILVLDFGSQYAHLIAKRLRLLGYYSEIAMPSSSLEIFEGAKGIIFSGGPSSVYEKNIPSFNNAILSLNIPILGLCYGHQLMALEYGGTVEKAPAGEFGFAKLTRESAGVELHASPLFEGISFPTQIWMSHQDGVVIPPAGFETIATTKDCPFAGLQNRAKKRYSLQFHVEVKDTPEGDRILSNFALMCSMQKNWNQEQVLGQILAQIRESANGKREKKVLLFLSGGVDSTVAFALLNKALGQDRVLGLHIDNGFMRKGESETIERRYRSYGFTNFIVEDASETFLKAVYHITDPQKKRMAVGETFITVRDEVVKRLGLDDDEWLLGQGTLYPDIIESGGTKNSHTIKTHHNRVEGIQELIAKGAIIEPLKDLYKDEVRIIGKKLGLDDELVFRHPFPGPGLSINVLCHDGVFAEQEKFEASKKSIADAGIPLAFTMCENDIAKKPSFSGISILPVKSVGVQGDFRTYSYPAVLTFNSLFSAFPVWDELEKTSSAITNAHKDINRTILTLWERNEAKGKCVLQEGYCDRVRLDQTREADAIVLEEFKKSRWYTKIFQHLTINLPFASRPDGCSIVLRPVVSEDVMTARFAHLDTAILGTIVHRISALPFVDAIYYDITNKPPATFGWE